ncbi:centrosomal protein 43 [Stigmatopora argus]
MSATDDDTELRDLLIQNLENNGVLNKLKAEMRAAVFLALEEQDRLENKTPLVNDHLKKCLGSENGRLAAALILDFMRVFHLDFSLAVFQPEIDARPSDLDGRRALCAQLGLSETEINAESPVLLELVRKGRRRSDQASFSAPSQDDDLSVDRDSPPPAEPDRRSPASDEDSLFHDPLPSPQKTSGWPANLRRRPADSRSNAAPGGEEEEEDMGRSRSPPRSTWKGKASPEAELPGGAPPYLDDEDDADDADYYDDFNSHRSDRKSEASISEDIEEGSAEGAQRGHEDTLDVSVSQLSVSVDYMEEVA